MFTSDGLFFNTEPYVGKYSVASANSILFQKDIKYPDMNLMNIVSIDKNGMVVQFEDQNEVRTVYYSKSTDEIPNLGKKIAGSWESDDLSVSFLFPWCIVFDGNRVYKSVCTPEGNAVVLRDPDGEFSGIIIIKEYSKNELNVMWDKTQSKLHPSTGPIDDQSDIVGVWELVESGFNGRVEFLEDGSLIFYDGNGKEDQKLNYFIASPNKILIFDSKNDFSNIICLS